MTNSLDHPIMNNQLDIAKKLVDKYGKSRFLRSESYMTESLRDILPFTIEQEKFLDSLISL